MILFLNSQVWNDTNGSCEMKQVNDEVGKEPLLESLVNRANNFVPLSKRVGCDFFQDPNATYLADDEFQALRVDQLCIRSGILLAIVI